MSVAANGKKQTLKKKQQQRRPLVPKITKKKTPKNEMQMNEQGRECKEEHIERRKSDRDSGCITHIVFAPAVNHNFTTPLPSTRNR